MAQRLLQKDFAAAASTGPAGQPKGFPGVLRILYQLHQVIRVLISFCLSRKLSLNRDSSQAFLRVASAKLLAKIGRDYFRRLTAVNQWTDQV